MTDGPPLTYQFGLDPAEAVRASRYVRRRQRFAWVTWAVWPVLFGLAGLYLATGVPWRDLWRLGLVVLMLGTLTVLAPWIQRRQLRRAIADSPTLREPQVYRFGDDGLTITAGATTIALGWDAILEAVETQEFLLLFYSKRQAYYVPKRAVGGPAEQAELRELLRARLGPRAAALGRA